MKVVLNGKEIKTDNTILADILVQQKAVKDLDSLLGIAVSVNDSIVPKAVIKDFVVKENDSIDVFYMLAGG